MDTNVAAFLKVPIDPLLRESAAPVERVGRSIDVAVLYRTHRARLVGLAAVITLDRQVAEEVVQDAFLGLQRHADHVDEPVGYLQRSVVNRAVSVQRRRRVAGDHVPAVVRPASLPEIDETWSVVCRLPPKQRAVIVLRFCEDMTVHRIAQVLGWPAGSVMSTLHRALKRLKTELG